MATVSTPLRLGDDFTSPVGSWEGYDQYQLADQEAVRAQKSITLRSFVTTAESVPAQIITLSQYTMGDLQGQQVGQIGLSSILVEDENWVSDWDPDDLVSISPWDTDNYHNLIINADGTGAVYQSVMTDHPIDITQPVGPTPCLVFHTYCLFDAIQGQIFVELTSDPNGEFSYVNIPTGVVPGIPSAKAPLLSSYATGTMDDAFRTFTIPLGDFVGPEIDLTQITGVRFFLLKGGNAIGVFGAVEVRDIDFDPLGLRIDTLRKRVYRNLDPDPQAGIVDAPMPILWRSDGIQGRRDPKPYDVEFAINFFCGSPGITAGQTRTAIHFYAREHTLDPVTMVDLNGASMASLDGRPIPQYSEAAGYLPRTQAELEIYQQADLDGEDMLTLERTPDEDFGDYVRFSLMPTATPGPGESAFSLQIVSAEGTPYIFPIPQSYVSTGLKPNQRYTIYVSLKDTTARIQLYESFLSGSIGALVLDSGDVYDDNQFARIRGRIGWTAHFPRGDSYLESIKDRKTVFGEYRSRPMGSTTPVMGAQLFVEHTGDSEHFLGFEPASTNIDSTKVSKESNEDPWSVSVIGPAPFQGIQSNLFNLFDLENSGAEFDIRIDDAHSLRGEDIRVFLVDEYDAEFKELTTTPIRTGEWHRVKALIPKGYGLSTGLYRLMITQVPSSSSRWSVRNTSVYTRSVIWDARSETPDPFSEVEGWIPFWGLVGAQSSLQFPARGSTLQVRGQALRQDAEISKIQILPKYAELGRLLEPI